MLDELNQSTVAAQVEVEVERECCALGRMDDIVGAGSIERRGRAGSMEGCEWYGRVTVSISGE
jgi:hypothetical protein